MLEHCVRGIDIHVGELRPEQGDGDQRTRDEQPGGADCDLGVVDGGIEKNLAAEVDFCTEQHGQAQHHVFDPPTHGAHRGAKGPFEVHQDKNGSQQVDQI